MGGRHTKYDQSLEDILTYIPKFQHKSMVVYISGDVLKLVDLADIVQQVAILHSLNIRIILVHGARPQISQSATENQLAFEHVASRRITSPVMMELVKKETMILSHRICSAMANVNRNGFLLSPLMGNFIKAKSLGIIHGVDHEMTGQVDKIHRKRLKNLLDLGYVPIINSLGFDSAGVAFNIRAIEIARHIAIAIGACKLVCLLEEDLAFLGDFLGSISHKQLAAKLETIVLEHNLSDLQALRLQEAVLAGQGGVDRTHLVNGLQSGSLLNEIFTHRGQGLLVCRDRYSHIRAAQPGDAPIILNLMTRANQHGEFRDRNLQMMSQDIFDYFVFELDGLVCGAVALHRFPEFGQAELAALVVDDHYRHKGIGKKLVDYLVEQAGKMGIKEILANTTRASQFFIENGFSQTDIGRIPEEIRKRWNLSRKAITMTRSLEDY